MLSGGPGRQQEEAMKRRRSLVLCVEPPADGLQEEQ